MVPNCTFPRRRHGLPTYSTWHCGVQTSLCLYIQAATGKWLFSTEDSNSSRVSSLNGSVNQWKKHFHSTQLLWWSVHPVMAADWCSGSIVFHCANSAIQLPYSPAYCCQFHYSGSHHRGCVQVLWKLRESKTVPQRSELKAPRIKSSWIFFMKKVLFS